MMNHDALMSWSVIMQVKFIVCNVCFSHYTWLCLEVVYVSHIAHTVLA